MATITQNQDGTLTVTMNPVELDTYSGLPSGQLQEIITLWIQDKSTQVFQQRFSALTPEEQGNMLLILRNAVVPVAPQPPIEPPVIHPAP